MTGEHRRDGAGDESSDAVADGGRDDAADGDGTLPAWPVAGLVLAVLWVFVRGVEPALDALVGGLLVGLAVGLPTAYLFRRAYPSRLDVVGGVAGTPYAVLYVLTFLREVAVANLDMTYRVLAPGPPLYSEVIFVPLRVESDLAVTTIANSITLTPGTVTLDHDPEINGLYVHVVDGRQIQDVVAPIRTWEDYALYVFDESVEPETEPRDVVVTGGAVDGD